MCHRRRFSSGVEQLIRNERVISSNLISGSPLFQEDYLLKLTDLGVLSDTTKGSLRTHKGALGSGKNGNRCRYRVCLAGVQSWPGSTSQLSHIDPTNAQMPNGF